jgi:hypothetical protein
MNKSGRKSSIENKEMAKRLIDLLQNKNIGFDSIENRPVSIPVPTIRKIAQSKRIENPSTALGIYTFMYARGREERTNKPWVNNEYIAKGLKLNPQTVAKYRKQLTELGLIQDVPLRKDGRIYKHVTHIRYYDGITIRDPQLIKFITTLCKGYTIGKVQCSETVVNAYSLPSEEESACSPSKKEENAICCRGKAPGQRSHKSFSVLGGDKPKNTPEHRLSVQFFQAVQDTVERNFPRNQLPKKDKQTGKRNCTAWDGAFRDFLQAGRFTYEQISQTIKWYASHIGKKCVPELYSAKTFCEEYVRVLKAIKREKDDQDKRLRQQRRDGTDPTQYPIVEKGEDGWTYYTYSDGSRGRKREIDKTHSESESLAPAWTIEEEGDDDFDAEAGEPYF